MRSHAWSTGGPRKWCPAAIALPRCISASREDVRMDLGAPWGCWYFASGRKDAVMEKAQFLPDGVGGRCCCADGGAQADISVAAVGRQQA